MKTCHVCQLSFDPARVPEGICPACLLMGEPTGSSASGTKAAAAWDPPTLEEMQTRLPAYEWLELIGRGGMGAVYKARQPSLERTVAIKVLPVHDDQLGVGFVQRFTNEARLMARMSHPAIVHVYDFGELQGGICYFVMEYVDGTDVARLVAANGRLPPAQAVSIAKDVCSALHHAHETGVVHRDIKPANVLLTHKGQVKVVDFGLAKQRDPALGSVTGSGITLGTPDYAAPETLISGKLVDDRADIYAVGVMLYNMLTGEIPRGVFRPVSKHLQTNASFDDVIRKAMNADRERRYQTANEMQNALESASKPRMAMPLRWLGAVTMILLVLGLGVVLSPHILPPDMTAPHPRTMAQRHAEWVFSKGGKLVVRSEGAAKVVSVSSTAELPEKNFVVEEVHFKDITDPSPRITAEELALWVPYMPKVKRFFVEGSPKLLRSFETYGLRELGRLMALESLSLDHIPELKDDDLIHFSPFNSLLHLSLANTSIDGTGFTHLRRTLVRLNVRGCLISEAGWAELKFFNRLQFLKTNDDFLPQVKRNVDGFIRRPELDAHFFPKGMSGASSSR